MKPPLASSLILAARVFTVVYGVILVVLAVIPSIEGQGFGASDGVLHAVAYGLFGGLLLVSVSGRLSVPRAAMAAVGGASAFGLLTEVLQFLVPYRCFEVLDVVADSIGAIAVVLFLLVSFKVLGGCRWFRT